ncbi:MAG: hypothetical protein GQ558_09390, partial [Thermoplasmata archaeon]|nr:hypothetical protein [Thermoplasmata archaeon]
MGLEILRTRDLGRMKAGATMTIIVGLLVILVSDFAESNPGLELEYSSASFFGESVSDLSAHSVAVVGDVNGDGFDDILIAAYKNGDGGSGTGQTYLYFGKRDGWESDINLSNANASFWGEDANDFSGNAIAGAGDVNGDGYDDFLIGAFWNNEGGTHAGQTYLILGKASGWSMDTDLSNADASFIGEQAGDESGWSVAGAGDVNGDGCDDIIIGALYNDEGFSEYEKNIGQTYLIFGKRSGWTMDTDLSSSDASFRGKRSVDRCGQSIAGAGDVDGDGYDDIIISTFLKTLNGTAVGHSYLIFGKASGWSMDTNVSNASASYFGEVNSEKDCLSVAGAGDVNGDGFDDILIGYWDNDEGGNDAGQTYLVLGKASGWSKDTNLSTADASFWGEAALDEAGRSIAGAGDINGDGYDDFLIGASGVNTSSYRAGKTYVILGKASGWSMDTNLSMSDITFLGENVNDESGWSVAGAGDVNGDGLDDILIGAHHNFATRGRTYLVFYHDGAPPRIEMDSTGMVATTGDLFTFNTTVSDNYAIGNVHIEYWYGDSQSHFNASAKQLMGNESHGTWLLNITIPWNSTDMLHYVIHCRDQTFYLVSSAERDVSVLDNDPPILKADATPDNATTGDVLTFSLYSSDNIQISDIWVEYWYGDAGTHSNFSMAHVSGDLWDLIITVPSDSLDTLHYFFCLMDNSSNSMTTATKDVAVFDNDLPILGADGTGNFGTTGDPFTFSLEVWDNLDVEEVRVAYRYGNGPSENAILDLSGGDTWMTTILVKDT